MISLAEILCLIFWLRTFWDRLSEVIILLRLFISHDIVISHSIVNTIEHTVIIIEEGNINTIDTKPIIKLDTTCHR